MLLILKTNWEHMNRKFIDYIFVCKICKGMIIIQPTG